MRPAALNLGKTGGIPDPKQREIVRQIVNSQTTKRKKPKTKKEERR